MTDSLRAAAALASKLGPVDLDQILPASEPVIDCDALAVDRIELRQIAGISAGGRLELSAGCNYDFGPVRHGHGRLDDGQPDLIGFTLSLGDDLGATVGPGNTPVLIDAEPLLGPTDVAGRVINAGSARFVVARPRPPRKRDGKARDETDLHPWVSALIPHPLDGSSAMDRDVDVAALVEQRRRVHCGPDEVSYRIDGGGALLWDRTPDHPLFGSAMVAMADVPVRQSGVEVASPVPVSVDLLDSPTMLAGERALQLAMVRHMIVSLATTVGPHHLQIELRSGVDDLGFIRRLPHAKDGSASDIDIDIAADMDAGIDAAIDVDITVDATADQGQERRRLVVVDRPEGRNRRLPPGFHDGLTSFLVLTGENDALSANADVLSIVTDAAVTIFGGERSAGLAAQIEGATPVGFAQSMTDELVNLLMRGA